MTPRRRALFLDRDGTIIRDQPYRDTPRGMKLLPRVAQGIRAWVASGFVPVIVTNQSGIARGLFTRETLDLIHARLLDLLRSRGVGIEAVYVCPHAPDGGCGCRKPKPGMLKRAAKDLRLDLRASVMIGDSPKDVAAGRAAGAKAILLGRDARDLLDAHRKAISATSGGRKPAGTTRA